MSAATIDLTQETEAKALVVPASEVRRGDIVLEGAPALPGDMGRSRAADYESWGLLGRIGQRVVDVKSTRDGDRQIFFGKTAKVTVEYGAQIAVERQVPTAAAMRARKVETVLFDAEYYVERAEKDLLTILGYQAGRPTMTDFLLHYGDAVVKAEAQLAAFRSFAAAVNAEGVDPVEAASKWVATEIFRLLAGRGSWSMEGIKPAVDAVAREAHTEAVHRFRQHLTAEAMAVFVGAL